MEKLKTSKRTLRGLINKAITESLSKLELPKSSKKIEKHVSKVAKKLAEVFTTQIKRESKKKTKAEKSLSKVEAVLKGKKKVVKNKVVKA